MAFDKDKYSQVLLLLPHDLKSEVESFWRKEYFPNRNEAIRELIKIGLRAYETGAENHDHNKGR